MVQQPQGNPGVPPRPLVDIGDTFHQWASIGDMLAGTYMGNEPFLFSNGDTGTRHAVAVEGVGIVTVLGTYQLNQKLAMVAPGGYVEITFVAEQPARGGPSPLKVFNIRTDSPQPMQQPPQLAQAPAPAGQLQFGGMPQTRAAPAAQAVQQQQRPRYPQSPNPPAPGVLQYLPDGTPVYGFTPDGTPLDANGQIIPQGLGD